MSDQVLQALERSSRTEPDRLALISPRGSLTVGELERRSSACALGLAQLGLGEGDRVALMVTPGADFLVSAFGLLKCGSAMVLIDPGIGLDNLGACLDEAGPRGFIGIPLAHLVRKWLGWARRSVRFSISTGLRWGLADYSLREIERAGQSRASAGWPPRGGDHPVAIAFTSGSTGPPKGVVYSGRMFDAQARMLQETYSIAPGEIDLATFPLFGLFDVGWRATTVFPEMDFSAPGSVDPEMIANTIRTLGVTHMFGSPALLNRLSRYTLEHQIRFPSLRRVLSAGAPVSSSVLERSRDFLVPPGDVHTPYGATEALPVSTIAGSELLAGEGPAQGRGVCIGRPFGGVEVEILAIRDDAIESWDGGLCLGPGEIGEITVCGENVSPAYFGRPEADRLAKIRDGERIWHRMGDLGYRDGSGRLWFCGRKVHRVQTAGMTLYSVQVEGVYNQHPDVFRSALVGIGKPGSQRAILCVELEPDSKNRRGPELVSDILRLGSPFPFGSRVDTVLFHDAFPVDIRHNAKIFRERLAVWAEEQLTSTAEAK